MRPESFITLPVTESAQLIVVTPFDTCTFPGFDVSTFPVCARAACAGAGDGTPAAAP